MIRIDLPKELIIDYSVGSSDNVADIDNRVRNILRQITRERFDQCFHRKDTKKKFYKLLNDGPIRILPPDVVGHKRDWAKWQQSSLPTMAKNLRYLFTKPSKAPALLSPFVFIDGRPTPGEAKGYLDLKFHLLTQYSLDFGLTRLEECVGLVIAEGDISSIDAESVYNKLADTAIKALPALGQYDKFSFSAFWILRTIGTKKDAQDFATPSMTFSRWLQGSENANLNPASWILPENSEAMEIYNRMLQKELPPEETNQLLRHFVHIGDLKKAKILANKVNRTISKKDRFAEWHSFLGRYAWLLVKQGRVEHARRIMEATLKNLHRYEDVSQNDVHFIKHARATVPLLWASTVVDTEYDSPLLESRIFDAIACSLRGGYYYNVMIAVNYLGRILMSKEEYVEAYYLWHYLWETATYQDHPLICAKAWCGLMECVLLLKEDDTYVIELFDKLYQRCTNCPESVCELLVHKAFRDCVRNNWKQAEELASQANSQAREYGLIIQEAMAEGVLMLVQLHEKNVLKYLTDNTKNYARIIEAVPAFRDYQTKLLRISGKRKFMASTYRRVMDILEQLSNCQ